MSGEIWVAIITSVFSFAGTVLAVVLGDKKNAKRSKEQADLTLYRLEELEKKQDKHNSLIERMFRVERRLDVDEERIKVANHRISDLENK